MSRPLRVSYEFCLLSTRPHPTPALVPFWAFLVQCRISHAWGLTQMFFISELPSEGSNHHLAEKLQLPETPALDCS